MTIRKRVMLYGTGLFLTLSALNVSGTESLVCPGDADARQEERILTTFSLINILRANPLNASVHNGKVVLSGRVGESALKDLAEQIARNVSGVRNVDNNIVVEAGYLPPIDARRNFGDIIGDLSTAAVITSKLMWSRYAEGIDAKVEAVAGMVTLQGVADSPAAKELAGLLAANTRGVLSVINHLQLIHQDPKGSGVIQHNGHRLPRSLNDEMITSAIKSTLYFSDNLNAATISISTVDGQVALSGSVPNRAAFALAIELVENVQGVRSVDYSLLKY